MSLAIKLSIIILSFHAYNLMSFSLLKVLPYWIAQFIGAFFGAVVVYSVYFGMQFYYNYKNDIMTSATTYRTT